SSDLESAPCGGRAQGTCVPSPMVYPGPPRDATEVAVPLPALALDLFHDDATATAAPAPPAVRPAAPGGGRRHRLRDSRGARGDPRRLRTPRGRRDVRSEIGRAH